MWSRRHLNSLGVSLCVVGMSACASTSSSAHPETVPRHLSEGDGAVARGAEAASAPQEPGVSDHARTLIWQATQQARAASESEHAALTIGLAREALHQAHHGADVRLGGSVPSAPIAGVGGDYRAILEAWRAPRGALSAGTTSRGKLLGAEELAFEGEHHVIIDRARPRDTRFGHPTMTRTLRQVAATVAESHPGSRLAIGNIAYRNGGDIRWSVSHNSGRDADIAFYVIDAMTREPLDEAPDLIAFDDEGRSIDKEGYLFDVPRNWSLAKALITHPQAQIQYLFISEGLKAQLLAHAQRIGEPEALITHAAEVLRQPTDSSPHNDHFHLRLTCDLADRLRGCVDVGPRWEWVNWNEEALRAQTAAMIPALSDKDQKVRLEALDYVATIDPPNGMEFALAVAAYNDDAAVRAQALKMASGFYVYTGASVAAIERLIRDERTTLDERADLYALMRRSLDPWTIPFALERLQDARVSDAERVYAARALAHQMEPALIPELIAQLGAQPSPKVREELVTVLRRIANHSEGQDWSRGDAAQVSAGVALWQRWWERHRELPRELWLAQGFVQALGLEPEVVMTRGAIGAMIDALPRSPDHVTYNINRTLRELTGQWSSLEQRDNKKLHERWSKWWEKHKHTVIDGV